MKSKLWLLLSIPVFFLVFFISSCSANNEGAGIDDSESVSDGLSQKEPEYTAETQDITGNPSETAITKANDMTGISDEAMSLNYFKSENIARYKLYKEDHPDFTDEQIVTYVNIGLDMEFYSYFNELEADEVAGNYLVLCNKFNKLPESYVPEGYGASDQKILRLVGDAQKAYDLMKAGAAKDNITLTIISGYRSYSYQSYLYNNYKASDPNGADTYSARPGSSEHQTGLAVDLNATVLTDAFEQTSVFKWLYANAHNYGFILRYPKGKTWITGYIYEPWHWRYVGVDVAAHIKEEDITFEEYYVKYLDPQNLPLE